MEDLYEMSVKIEVARCTFVCNQTVKEKWSMYDFGGIYFLLLSTVDHQKFSRDGCLRKTREIWRELITCMQVAKDRVSMPL